MGKHVYSIRAFDSIQVCMQQHCKRIEGCWKNLPLRQLTSLAKCSSSFMQPCFSGELGGFFLAFYINMKCRRPTAGPHILWIWLLPDLLWPLPKGMLEFQGDHLLLFNFSVPRLAQKLKLKMPKMKCLEQNRRNFLSVCFTGHSHLGTC